MGILMKNSVNYSNSLIEIKPEIYSLEEREIGVWTDGKPLYQKTYYYDNQTTIGDGYTPILTLSGINHLYVTGFLINTSDNGSYTLPYAFNNKTTTLYYDNGAIGVRVANDTWGPDWDIVVTIQYTKTTDMAGSGIWSTTGAPNHHYSTSEQVVGTWVDGSTIYEKTFDLGSDLVVSQNNWTSTGILVGDIGKVLNIWAITSAGTCWGDLSVALNINSYICLLCARNGDTEAIRYFTIQYTKSS